MSYDTEVRRKVQRELWERRWKERAKEILQAKEERRRVRESLYHYPAIPTPPFSHPFYRKRPARRTRGSQRITQLLIDMEKRVVSP